MISYATIHKYFEYLENTKIMQEIAWNPVGDLKEYQRYWAYEYIINKINNNQITLNINGNYKYKILEIGAGHPKLISTINKKTKAECWILDPYEGCGSGPDNIENIAKEFPNLRFINGGIGEFLPELPEEYFDFVYSVSVIEHIPFDKIENCFDDMLRITKKGGSIIHALDCPLDGEYCQPLKEYKMVDIINSIVKKEHITNEEEDKSINLSLNNLQNAKDAFFVSPLYWFHLHKRFPNIDWFKTYKRVISLNITLIKK